VHQIANRGQVEKVAKKFEKVSFSGGFYSKRPDAITPQVDLVPANMPEINI
jgi:hypothetical protein